MGYSCDLPYTFKNKLSLNKDLKEFRRAVKDTRISGNLDGPEGGLEAMMQVRPKAWCGAWKNCILTRYSKGDNELTLQSLSI